VLLPRHAPPALQFPSVVVHVRWPEWPDRHPVRPSSRQSPQIVVMQLAPGGTVQACISIMGMLPEHVPPPQIAVVHVRDCVPVVVHASMLVGTQAPKGGHDGVPHGDPSVDDTVHACISVVITGAHAPA
jgi:hypothetical protein